MKKNKNIIGAVALILIGVIFGAVLVSGFGWVRPSWADIIIGAKTPPVTDVDINTFSKAFVEVAQKVTPSIVKITVAAEMKKTPRDDFFFFFPFRDDLPREQMGSGSGVIISEDGYILTNNHVVENASKVEIELFDRRILDATVVGTDPQTDLAVIKVEAENLQAAYLGNSDDIQVGQWVMAIGNPMSLASTVTAGIISAKGRDIGIIKNRDNSAIEDFIQTDAAINPGNSGGALVDLSGAVVGINTAIATGQSGTYIGYGFAIPINMAKSISKQLIATGKVNRGYIGVNITPLDPVTARAMGMDKANGIMVTGLLENGAAAKADIKEGDIILSVDGRLINQPNELQSYIASRTAGDKVTLQIYRDGKTFDKSVTLKSRNEDSKVEPARNDNNSKKPGTGKLNQMTFDSIGMTVKDMTENERKAYKVDNGVMITDVKTLGKAYGQKLFAGLVITQIDRRNIQSVDEFDSIIKSKKGIPVLLKVVDNSGQSRFVGLEIPE